MTRYPFETQAILISQPMGEFYVARLPASLLLEVGFSDVLSATTTDDPERPYKLEGNQREVQHKRLTQIGAYIDREDSAFPNSIIIAANIRQEDGLIEEDVADDEDLATLPGANDREVAVASQGARENRRWRITERRNGCTILTIPGPAKLAAIIDGQHRLYGFTYAELRGRLDMDLICAIYMDLPKPYQAQLFATINSNQKKVDKSLTYELFGYNVDDEPPEYWAPDKLAVFLTRRLGAEKESPLLDRISVAPRKDTAIQTRLTNTNWKLSTAVVVDGIMRLLTSNPKSDANDMLTPVRRPRSALADPEARRDRSPLREAFVSGQDAVIYQMVRNYMAACQIVFWSKASPTSFITRTVGVQALFDILRLLSGDAYTKKVISVSSFVDKLTGAVDIDFGEAIFRNASGSGRSLIRRAIQAATLIGTHVP